MTALAIYLVLLVAGGVLLFVSDGGDLWRLYVRRQKTWRFRLILFAVALPLLAIGMVVSALNDGIDWLGSKTMSIAEGPPRDR